MADLSITSAKYDAARADAEQRFYTATQGRPATEQQRDQSNLVREAIVKFATAWPDCVYRSSGSAVRLPMTVMRVSPATRPAPP